MEILINILKEIPAGIDRWLFILLGIVLYFSPTIYSKLFKKKSREDELQEIKTLLEIKNLAMEIAIKEKRDFSSLPEIINEKGLISDMFPVGKAQGFKEHEISRRHKIQYGLTGSLSVVLVLTIFNIIFHPDTFSWGWILIRDLCIGIIAGFGMVFYPSNTKKPIIIAGAILPFIIAMVLILFRVI